MNGNYNTMDTAQGISWINVLAGIWLIISPWVLGFGALQAAMLDTLIVGIAVLILAAVRLSSTTPVPGVSWLNFILGIWLIISPFVLDYSNVGAPSADNIIVGIIVGLAGLFSALGAGTRTYSVGGPGRHPLR